MASSLLVPLKADVPITQLRILPLPCSTLPAQSLFRTAVFWWHFSLKQQGPPLPQPTVPSKVALVDAQKEQAPCSRDKACCQGALPSRLGILGQGVASALITLQFDQWDQASCCRVPVILQVLGESSVWPRQGSIEGALSWFLWGQKPHQQEEQRNSASVWQTGRTNLSLWCSSKMLTKGALVIKWVSRKPRRLFICQFLCCPLAHRQLWRWRQPFPGQPFRNRWESWWLCLALDEESTELDHCVFSTGLM